jgi:HlyD family secretion protein
MRHRFSFLVVLTFAASLASADDVPPTVVAAKQTVAFTVDASGAFDATSAVEASAKTQAYSDELEIEECVAGGPVQKGALLVRFKTDKIDEAIAAAERDLAVARATFAVQSEDHERQLATTAAQVAKAEFDAKTAREALERFLKSDKPLRLEESEHGVQGVRNWIADQTEEFAQLEKMYKTDDLTEETEEIVLRRTRRDLERAKKSLDFQTRHDALLRESDLPREQEGLEIENRRATADRDRTASVTKLQQEQATIELVRAKANLEKQERDVAKLKADRERLTVVAPETGVAVPGALLRGKWQNLDDMRKALKKGGKLHGNDVLFTIVRPGDVRVVATVPESAVFSVRPGQDAQIAPTAAGDLLLDAKVAFVSPAASGGDFEVVLDLVAPDARLLPGLACKARIAVGSRSAFLVPSAALEDGFEKSVYVMADGKPQKRAVRVGAAHDGAVEITAGVAEGDRVLETAPKKN